MALRTGCSKRGAALARPSESPLAARHSCSIGSEDVPRLVLPGDLIAHLFCTLRFESQNVPRRARVDRHGRELPWVCAAARAVRGGGSGDFRHPPREASHFRSRASLPRAPRQMAHRSASGVDVIASILSSASVLIICSRLQLPLQLLCPWRLLDRDAPHPLKRALPLRSRLEPFPPYVS